MKHLFRLHHVTHALCAITLANDLPGERFLLEGEPGGGGGGEPPKTFTQDEVNAFLAKERKKLETKYADFDDVKTKAGKVTELEAQLNELTEKLEMAGKGEKEREKLLAEKLTAKLEKEKLELAKERDEAKAAAEQSAKALRTTRIQHTLTSALTGAKALPGAIDKATRDFMSEAEIDFDEKTGKITSVTLDGVPYADPAKASEAYLKANPFYASAPAGGGGSRGPNGAPLARDWRELPTEELADMAWNSAPTGAPASDPNV